MNTKDLMRIYGMPPTVAKKISADPSEFRYWHKCGESAYNGCLKWIDKRNNCKHCQLCQKCCRCVIYDGNSLLESAKNSVNQNILSLEPKAEPTPQIKPKVNTLPSNAQPTKPTNIVKQPEKQTPIPTNQNQPITVTGKMEVIIKTSQYPEDAKTVTNNWKEFVVNTGDKEVIVTVRPRVFEKLVQAKREFPQWVAAINGRIGNINEKGFNLVDVSIQVFEKKPKPETPLLEQSKQQNPLELDTIKSTSTTQICDQQPIDDIAATPSTTTQSQLIQEPSLSTAQQAITGESTRPESTLTTLKPNSLLSALDITHFDKDIRLMSYKELKANFAAGSGRILLTKLFKNIIWQAYEHIKTGIEIPIEGNLRTFWYLWVKPVLSHFPSSAKAKTDAYQVMIEIFSNLVLEDKLFSYQDFDFTDGNWENRRIGSSRPEVLVFAGNKGWIRFLRELNLELGCSIIVLAGFPSAISTYYTTKHIGAVVDNQKTPLKLIGIVDFDPAGHTIAQVFQNQLSKFGFANSTLTLMIDPKHYSKEEIEGFKFPLPKSQKNKLQAWLKLTDGINGKPFGLESESMPRNRLKSLIKDLII